MPGMALALFAGPLYVAAACAAILRRPLAYAVTAKGRLASGEAIATFRLHLWWAGVASVMRMLLTSRMDGLPIGMYWRSGMRYSRQVAVRPCASRWVTPSRTW